MTATGRQNVKRSTSDACDGRGSRSDRLKSDDEDVDVQCQEQLDVQHPGGWLVATVAVPSAWVEQGYLPHICARHGGPATHASRRRFHTSIPPWVFLLILVGVLVFVIVAYSLRRTVTASLPACDACAAERRTFVVGVAVCWIVSCCLLVIALALTSEAVLVVSLLAMGASLVAICLGDTVRVGGTLSDNRAWVQLKRVDHTFAAAIAGALQPQPLSGFPTQVAHPTGHLGPAR